MTFDENECRSCGHNGKAHRSEHMFDNRCKLCDCYQFEPKYYINLGLEADEKNPPVYETECKSEPICPHCGEEMSDAWEFMDGQECAEETECGYCLKTFFMERRIDVSYSTYRNQDEWR